MVRRNWPESCSKCCDSKRRKKDLNGHTASFKSSKEKNDTLWEMESKIDFQSTHKEHIHYHRARDYGTENDLLAPCHKKFWNVRNRELLVFCSLNDGVWGVLDYTTYCLKNQSSHHDENMAGSVPK